VSESQDRAADEPESESGASEKGNGANAGIVLRFENIADSTVIDSTALSEFLGVTKRTIRRMVSRHELPPPFPLAGRSSWFAGKVLAHFKAVADKAEMEAEREAKRLQKFSSN